MKNLLLLSLLLTCRICGGQNLVPNPSFEDALVCPYFYSEVYNCLGWYSCAPTPDYYNSCNTTWVGVPNNFVGVQQAATGQAYCGLFTYWIEGFNGREIIGSQLTSTLIPGIKYFASMKVSLADSQILAANNLGISFTTTAMTYDTVPYILNTLHPKIYSQAVITDYTNWVTISGSFIADSSYQFIQIGNFLADSLTTTIASLSPAAHYCCSYYYIDDVCVSTDSLTCNTPVGIHQTKQNAELSLFPNPFSSQLTLTLSNNEPATVTLYDVFSRQIMQQAFTTSTTINTGQLANGIYFYELRNEKGVMKKGKVIKQ